MGLSLPEFLDRAAGKPFEPGAFDCCLWLADWGRELTGIDGAEKWRGAYTDALGCLAVIKAHGGVARLVRAGATAIGMKRLHSPKIGAVGVLRAATLQGHAHVGGIYTGKRWVFLTPKGLRFSKGGPVAAWGL